MSRQSYKLEALGAILGAELRGDASIEIDGLADLAKAGPSHISFLASPKYASALKGSSAAAVILREEDLDGFDGAALVVTDPYLAFAKLSRVFETRKKITPGIHPSAVVSDSAKIASDVAIAANCVIGEHVVIAAGAEIAAGVVIGDGVKVGRDALIHPNVVLYHQVELGDRVIIHANTTIGSDGFGFAPNSGRWQKIHQLGRVIIGDDVEIGANTSIDRGALEDTLIENNVIIDNQVHIAHNCIIGEGSAIAGCVGMAGSTKIGKNCIFGGACAVNGHLEIADGSFFNGATIVTRGNKEPGSFASAAPIQEANAWRKNSARYRNLDSMFKRLTQLEKLVGDNIADSTEAPSAAEDKGNKKQ